MFALRDLLKDLNFALELVDEDLDVTAVIRPYRAAASSQSTAPQCRVSG
jgi:hypothetical protein